MIPNVIVRNDTQLRLTSNTTIQGAAQNKGTATDLMLVILAGQDGANAVAGTVTNTIQGSNLTTSASFTNTVTADKGTVVNTTVAGMQVLHFAQLQFQYYRLALSAAASTTADTSAIWNFFQIQDSFDNTQN